MQNKYSLNTLAEFVKTETEELETLGLSAEVQEPSEHALQNILNYSKQLSVRKSRTLGSYIQNLN